MDKKISLEHAIRNIMTEAVGVGGTDKYKGTPSPFLKPAPHIKPKVGDAHLRTATANAERANAKIQNSETMKEEENLEEGSKAEIAKIGIKTVEKGAEYADDAAKAAKEFAKDFWKKIKTAEPENANLPSKTKENLPVKVEPKTDLKVEPKTDLKVEPKLEPKVQTQTKTDLKVEPKVEPKTDLKVEPKLEPKVQTQTKTDLKVEPKVEPKTDPKLGGPPPTIPKLPSGDGGNKKRGSFKLPNIHPEIISGLQGYVPVKTYMHFANDRVTFGESKEDLSIKQRSSEINSRRSAIIKNAIKNSKSTINPNPKLKHPEVDQT